MKRNKAFWSLATVVIFFALGWYLSFLKYDHAHKIEVLATSEHMLCQFEQVLRSEKITISLMRDKKDLLEDKRDFSEDSFIMMGGDKRLANIEKAILLSELYTRLQEMIYNAMAQTADPSVFELGIPAHVGKPDIESSNVI